MIITYFGVIKRQRMQCSHKVRSHRRALFHLKQFNKCKRSCVLIVFKCRQRYSLIGTRLKSAMCIYASKISHRHSADNIDALNQLLFILMQLPHQLLLIASRLRQASKCCSKSSRICAIAHITKMLKGILENRLIFEELSPRSVHKCVSLVESTLSQPPTSISSAHCSPTLLGVHRLPVATSCKALRYRLAPKNSPTSCLSKPLTSSTSCLATALASTAPRSYSIASKKVQLQR